MSNSMQPVWSRLEAIFKERYPTLFASLNPPATIAQVDAFEEATRLRLPADVRDSYLLHDGCKGIGGFNEGDGPLLFCGYRWSSLSDALDLWRYFYEVVPYEELDDSAYDFLDEPDNGWDAVRPWNHFPRCWFPIGQIGDDHSGAWFIDMLPGPKGSVGQLVKQSMGMSSLVVTASFAEYLHALTESLEKGEIEYRGDGGKWPLWMWRYKDSGKGFLSPQYGW
jgi:cell wall assembly regulator SMI1